MPWIQYLFYGNNLEVAGNNNYYESASKVLVHNKPWQVGRIKLVSKSESPIWKELSTFRGKTKISGKGKNTRYYQWDHTHGDIEVYDNTMRHLGSMDPFTGKMYKSAVKGRKLNK